MLIEEIERCVEDWEIKTVVVCVHDQVVNGTEFAKGWHICSYLPSMVSEGTFEVRAFVSENVLNIVNEKTIKQLGRLMQDVLTRKACEEAIDCAEGTPPRQGNIFQAGLGGELEGR